MSAPRVMVLIVCATALAACEREERSFRPDPVADEVRQQIALTSLSPGPSAPSESRPRAAKDYERNAYHLAEGKRLFRWFNCNGCHANGGGGSGPALIDDKWIYGGEIENIVATIREGRPNGMPSFRGRIPDDQIWEIAAYIRSMSGNVPASAAPNRDDRMMPRPAENRAEPNPPVPAGAERP